MAKYSKVIALALLVMGVVLAIVAFMVNTKKDVPTLVQTSAPTAAPKISVVVAQRDLPAGHVLQAEDVQVAMREQRPAQGFASAALVVGRSTAVAIAQDEPLMGMHLLEGVSGMLQAGERAVSIRVDEASAVGHKVQAGDWVDVFVVFKREGEGGDLSQSRLLMPKKKVLAYGAQLPPAAQASEDKNEEGGRKERAAIARTAVLGVPVEEVNRLLLAEQYGQIQLALRSPLDASVPSPALLEAVPGLHLPASKDPTADPEQVAMDTSLQPLTVADITAVSTRASAGAPAARAAARAPNAPQRGGRSVEVIRGTRSEKVSY